MLNLQSFEELATKIIKHGTRKTMTVSLGDGIERKALDKYVYGKATLYLWYADTNYPSVEIRYQNSKKKRSSVELVVRCDPTAIPQNGIYSRLTIYRHDYCPDKWSNFESESIASERYYDLTAHAVVDRLLER